MAQRLIRKICNDCALNTEEIQKLHPDIFTDKENELKLMGINNSHETDSKIRFSNPEGCPKCNNKGEIGRKLVIEYIEITDTDREFILKGDMEGWRKKLSENNFKSIESQLINHVKSGIIDASRATEQME